MKNSIYLIILILVFNACKKEGGEPSDIVHYSGDAVIYKSASVDTSMIVRDTLFNLDSSFAAFLFNYPIELDLYFIKNLDLSYPNNPLKVNFFTSDPNPVVLDTNQLQKPPIDTTAFYFKDKNYGHLILFNSELDNDMMYYASTGFFLEQYIRQYNGQNLTLGFSDALGQVDFIKTDLMPSFYDKTREINKSKSVEPQFKFKDQNYIALIKSIKKGIQELKKSNNSKKHLTLINYSRLNPSSLDSLDLKSLRDELKLNPSISLNIISLFPVDPLQIVATQSGGFFENDITYIDDYSAFTDKPEDLEKILKQRSFPSSYVIQNLEQLIAGQNNKFQKYIIHSILLEYDSNSGDLNSAKQKIFKERYHIEWQPNKYLVSPHLYFKLIKK